MCGVCVCGGGGGGEECSVTTPAEWSMLGMVLPALGSQEEGYARNAQGTGFIPEQILGKTLLPRTSAM